MFAPHEAHITIALVLSGGFGQFADPLDWTARGFGLDVKVDRQQLMESLAVNGGRIATRARADALGSDRRTRFRVQLFGRCEGSLVALCALTINPNTYPVRELEERMIQMLALNERIVLGIQATFGHRPTTVEPIENEDPLIRMFPLNAFNRAFFQEKIELFERDKKLKILDLGHAVYVQLAKPWLYYDVPRPGRRLHRPMKLLPF